MRILTFTNLYPNRVQSRHGIFVEQRLLQLVATGKVEARVIAPVPWFPFSGEGFGHYAQYSKIPKQENRNGIDIYHPRYLTIPKIGMSVAPLLMSRSMRKPVQSMLQQGFDFDLIDAHYFYPDGVAAVLMGKKFNKPTVITARGTDINVIPNYSVPRRLILWAAEQCAAIITVSAALKKRLVELGVKETKIHVLRNGVDLEKFKPHHHVDLNTGFKNNRKIALSVGNLVAEKGHDLTLKAIAKTPDVDLLIIGDGNQSQNLKALAKSLGIEDRVKFMSCIPQEDLKSFYSAAEVVVLSSIREGMPNVILEAIACGVPVVATDVGGVKEIISDDRIGTVINNRSVDSLTKAIQEVLSRKPDREYIRSYASTLGWESTVDGILSVFNQTIQQRV